MLCCVQIDIKYQNMIYNFNIKIMLHFLYTLLTLLQANLGEPRPLKFKFCSRLKNSLKYHNT